MTMQTLIAVCDSLWLDSTTNMLSQIVIYSFLVLSIFYLKNCHQGVLWLIYCMLFSPPPSCNVFAVNYKENCYLLVLSG